MPNILVDIRYMNRKLGGVYQYSVALLRILSFNGGNYKFYVLCENPDRDIKDIVVGSSHMSFTNVSPKKKNKLVKTFVSIVNASLNVLTINRKISRTDIYDSIVKKYSIDIIHSPAQSLVKKKNVKSICTLHDVQELYFPQFFTAAQRAKRAVNYKKAIDGADAVVVSYDHIKHDIVNFFDKKSELVHVVLLDMKNLWFENISENTSGALSSYNLPGKFLLYPASTWEHKNHKRLIEAVALIKDSGIRVVCTGNKTDYFEKTLQPLLNEHELEKHILFLGIVSDEELFQLYQNCHAVIVPTLYEAGSFPLMESMLMGIPVICSNVTSLPITIGNDKFVFNPNDAQDIIDKMEKIWFDEAYRAENIEVAKVSSQKLRNNEAADKMYKIYDELLTNNSHH